MDKAGKPIAVADGSARALGLGHLRTGDSHDGERLDEVGNEAAILRDAVHLQGVPRLADRVYGRYIERGDTTYLQYWFWYYYNPKDVAGGGRHEGDWEMIQVRLEAGEPRCAVYAQHDHARREDWARLRHHPAGDGTHPVVYVAAESHASYYEDGTHPAFGRADNAYGDGPAVLPQVEEFGDWAGWRGRWGNSKGILAWLWFIRNPPAGNSPRSPGHQGAKWKDPAAFEKAAKDNVDKEKRWLWKRGTQTYPLQPEILDAGFSTPTHVTVRYRIKGRFLRRPRHLLVSVNAPDERGDLVGRTSVAKPPKEGVVEVDLADSPGAAVVLASTFNRVRQRSAVASFKLAPPPP